MGWLPKARENVSINDLAPVLAEILIRAKRDRIHKYGYGDELFVPEIKHYMQGRDWKISEGHLKKISKMLRNLGSDIAQTQLLEGLFRQSIYMTRKSEFNVDEVFANREEFEQKFHYDLMILIKGRMRELGL